jgi:hypothetical protein
MTFSAASGGRARTVSTSPAPESNELENLFALKTQYEEVSKRLDGLTRQVAKLTAQLAILHPSWPKR